MANLFSRKNKINTVTFGDDDKKTVKIRKITVGQWKELFEVVNALPQLIISVYLAKPEERIGYIMVTLGEALEDIARIISTLTGIDEKWIVDNASADQIVAYLAEMAKYNNFGDLLKNVQSVLSLNEWTILPKAMIQSAEA